MAGDQTDPISSELDRLERILSGREAEIQRLKTELALKTLYIEELQTTLESQARELEAFDARLQRMEQAARRAQSQQADTSRELRRSPVPLFIRIRKAISD